MQIQRIWLNLFCMGWKSGAFKHAPSLHWLLKFFPCYRKGYANGVKWRRQKYLEGLLAK